MDISAEARLINVAVPRALDGVFTYRVPAAFASQVRVGSWVRVSFGRSVTHAFVVEDLKSRDAIPAGLNFDNLKEVLECGDEGFTLPEDVLKLCRWTSDYYCAPLGEVLNSAAPTAALGLKNAKSKPRELKSREIVIKRHVLTEDQTQAYQCLELTRNTMRRDAQSPHVALLHGVTGSGKTEIYLELARKVLAENRGVILLVPEIALTTQLHQRIEEGLGAPAALWHSAVSDGRRRDETAALLRGELCVAVGARSAVFAPVKDLGLIVVDEEHDPVYKQEDRVRYHARDLAVLRGKLSGAMVVLGSATPSLESRERCRQGKYVYVSLEKSISSSGPLRTEMIDLRKEPLIQNTQAVLAQKTVSAIAETITAGEQAIVFLNRRGFAAFLMCKDCGNVCECLECSISLTVHKKRGLLVCHVCGFQEPIPDLCSKCHGMELQLMGAGTESLEEELPRLLPEMKALRLDRDQITSASRLEAVLNEFRKRNANVLMGTQMLVKGHDFPNVTLVVVVLADGLFRWPDFRAPERAYQILKQVSGRAGRADRPGRVMIQAYDLDHPVLKTLRGEMEEEQFLGLERDLRKEVGYPPFKRMARLRFEASTRQDALSRAEEMVRALQGAAKDKNLEVLGPSEAFLERAKGSYRWDVLLRSADFSILQRAVIAAKKLAVHKKWQILADIDPQGV